MMDARTHLLLNSDFAAFAIDTHVGASSVMMACPPCAALAVSHGMDDIDALSADDMRAFADNVGTDDALCCEFCGRVIDGQLS